MVHRSRGARFWEKVDRRGPDECWPWLGATKGTARPYGQFWDRGRTRPASQVAWELFHRQPFPDNHEACHTCDEPNCVNPSHIFAGTHAENQLDSVEKGRHPNAQRMHCPQGHPLSGDNLKVRNGWRFCRECDRAHKRASRKRIKERALAGSPSEKPDSEREADLQRRLEAIPDEDVERARLLGRERGWADAD